MKKAGLRILPWTIITLVAFFFGKALVDNWKNIDDSTFHFNWLALPGVVLLVLAVVMSGLLWGRLLSGLAGRNISYGDAVRIHSASWLLKYIPGQVGSLINKLTWAKSQGVSQKSTATSFVYENVLTTLASLVISLPLISVMNDSVLESSSLFLPVLIIIPIAIFIYQPVFYKLLNFVFKKLGKKPFRESDFLSTGQLLKYLALYLVPRVLNAVGFVFIASSLLPIEPSMYMVLGATYVFASIVGLLAVFVPGGIGVREAVIVLFVGLYFPVEQAIVLAIIARLYATIADVGVFGVYLILNKGRIRQR